ncbi:cupin domain-containing protein [Natrialba sp. SSL1]|uniref:cupin domain-containing protein n=1 Tax=Natrialba sp. SSL1 TaxID=1869245 RepID=UPI0008F89D5F|nr:cupin domain-containing protein [Natrialba sp. SSL1]OIB58614.1 cupin [Natrialba sp. SSL1]
MDHRQTDDVVTEEVANGVFLGTLSMGERASMKYWQIDPGASLPTHEHEHEQIGYVLSGTLTAILEDEEVLLEEGDAYRFPSNEYHGAENRSDEPAVGLGVLAPPRNRPEWRDR